MKIAVNTLGLLFATAGSFLVWLYLGDLNMADPEALKQGKIILVVPTSTPQLCAKLILEKKLSKVGLTLIVLGGVLQAVSNYLPE